MSGCCLVPDANDQTTIEFHQCGVGDGGEIVEAPLIVRACSRCEVDESWTGAIFGDQAAQCTRLCWTGSLRQFGYSGAFREKLRRTEGRLAEIDHNPTLAVIAPHPPVPVGKNLEPLDA